MTEVPEIPITCGQTWTEITRGIALPEHEITRIKDFLSGMNSDDLVYTKWFGSVRRNTVGRQVHRLVIVGANGAGRCLRRDEHDVSPEELLDDVASVYLCAIDDEGGSGELRYVFIDCTEEEEATLVCRRSDFEAVFTALRGKTTTGTVWRGNQVVDAGEWESLDESDYLFSDEMLNRVYEHTADFLESKEAEQLSAWQVPPRRGVLLHGPPGNGKTVLTRMAVKRAIAAGVNVVLFTVSSLSRNVGSNLRLAASRSPALILIDDIDVHCGRRAKDMDGQSSTTPRQRFLADLLEFLDGISTNEGYALLATTNAIDQLDPALLRAGRLDVHIGTSPPSESFRGQLLERDLALPDQGAAPAVADAVSIMEGCSYADIAELARRYKIAVVRKHGKPTVDQDLLEAEARDFAQELDLRGVEESGPQF